jgi:hypothetical protein
MKHFFWIILLVISLFGCDDGDFNIETFDFSTVSSASCNSGASGFFVYKINGSEVLLLQIPENNFINEITPIGVPRTVNEANNSSFISGFTHSIEIRNVTFQKGNGTEQLYTLFNFGNYITTNTPPANFIDFTLKECDNNFDFVYKIVGNQSISLLTDSSLFVNEVTVPGIPRTALIDGTNQLYLDYYAANINDIFICTSPLPTVPARTQRWVAQNGVANVSGIIEVVTTEEYEIPTDNQSPLIGYRQTITLKKIRMERNGVTFDLGDSYELGAIVTPL